MLYRELLLVKTNFCQCTYKFKKTAVQIMVVLYTLKFFQQEMDLNVLNVNKKCPHTSLCELSPVYTRRLLRHPVKNLD